MKKNVKKCFNLLFQHRDYLYIVFFSFFIGFTCLILAYGKYTSEIFNFYLCSIQLLAMNILPVCLVCLLVYSITGVKWVGILFGGGLATVLSIVNYYKLSFRDDPLYIEDLFSVFEGTMLGIQQFDLFLDFRIVAVLVVFILCIFLSYKLYTPIRKTKHRLFMVPLFAITLFLYIILGINENVYNSLKMFEGLSEYHPTESYICKGFIYPFINSIRNVIDLKPQGYDEKEIKALLDQFEEFPIEENEKVNIIAIMREAYVDFSLYNIEGLDIEDYSFYHELKESSITGKLVNNIFAGGTIKTENSFLTGNYFYKNVRKYANSHLWYFDRQGYTISGNHPFFEWFYSRDEMNEYLGFDTYEFLEDGVGAQSDSYYPEDFYLYDKIYQDLLTSAEKNSPLFSFNVTVSSHGPYFTDFMIGDKEYLTGDYSEQAKNAMNNYMSVISECDLALQKFIQKISDLKEPVIILLFSDHLPWMGNNHCYYDEMGINFDLSSAEGFMNYYSTEYLIWANQSAKNIMGREFIGKSDTISPCYLLNQLFSSCGWKGSSFLQVMDIFKETLPVITDNEHFLYRNVLTNELPYDAQEKYQDFLCLQYYWRNRFLDKNP